MKKKDAHIMHRVFSIMLAFAVILSNVNPAVFAEEEAPSADVPVTEEQVEETSEEPAPEVQPETVEEPAEEEI